MFLAQHHRPSNASSRLVHQRVAAALYFAVADATATTDDKADFCEEFLSPSSEEFRSDGFAIFVMDPGAINKEICDLKDPVDISAEPAQWAHYLDPTSHGNRAYFYPSA